MIKALIFDFDGLILDTETPELLALQEAYALYGQTLTAELYGRAVGSEYGKGFEPLSYLRGMANQNIEADAFWAQVNARRMARIEQNTLLPGVLATLQDARRLGLRLAVASSSPHAWVEGHLRRLEIHSYFEAICCREDVPQIKPAPDLFLAALRVLNLPPEESLALEDSPNGALAAQKAGMRVVVVPNPVTENLAFAGSPFRIPSLAEVGLEDLLKRLS